MNALARISLLILCISLPALAQRPLGSAATAGAPAQQPESPVAPAPAPSSRQIHLDVIVADRAGNPTPGLTASSFTVLDNKQPQKVVGFRATDAPATAAEPPTHVILIVDEVNTSFSSVAYERSEIKKYLARSGEHLLQPTSFVFFTDTGTQMQTSSSQNGNALMAALDSNETALRTIRRSSGFYGATDRFSLSLTMLRNLATYEATQPGRKLVVWISPGWPILSGPNVYLSDKEEKGLMASIVNMSMLLRQARITLSSVDPLGTADAGGLRSIYYKEFLKPVDKPQNAQAGDLALEVLATQSGGRVLKSSNDIAAAIATCVSDAHAYYTLTIEAPADVAAPGKNSADYHALEVRLDQPGLVARTRAGYYSAP